MQRAEPHPRWRLLPIPVHSMMDGRKQWSAFRESARKHQSLFDWQAFISNGRCTIWPTWFSGTMKRLEIMFALSLLIDWGIISQQEHLSGSLADLSDVPFSILFLMYKSFSLSKA